MQYNGDTFRYYIIYITDQFLSERYSYLSAPSQLYAFTTDKKLADTFMNQRKDGLFKIRKKDLTSYEAMNLEKKYRLSYLITFGCVSRSDISNQPSIVDVVLTEYEKQNIISTLGVIGYTNIVRDCYQGYKIFDFIPRLQIKYIRSLLDIGFVSMNSDGTVGCAIGRHGIQYDSLEMLVSLYSVLFR